MTIWFDDNKDGLFLVLSNTTSCYSEDDHKVSSSIAELEGEEMALICSPRDCVYRRERTWYGALLRG
jgi:hypothetical protein